MFAMAAIANSSPGFDSSRPYQRDPWEPQTNHENGQPLQANGHTPPDYLHITSQSTATQSDPNRSPAAVSLRAFLLGVTFSTGLLAALYLASFSPLWRLPFFLCSLSLFHSLEYFTTAVYNPTAATVSAFLLSQNGRAYNIAHGMAFIECGLHWLLLPDIYLVPAGRTWLIAGFTMLVIGQAVRTTAMAHAGSNFNHLVQNKRKVGHELVTDGIYGWLRHPSYFGFFWWGLGTQVILGNCVCLIGYALVLWRFFSRRIESELSLNTLSENLEKPLLTCEIVEEESLLIDFFEDDYVKYRAKTRVGIPLIP